MKKTKSITQNVDMIDLSQSLIEACKQEGFRTYINQLSCPDEILMKYTSSLQDSFVEYNHCCQCKSLSHCQNKVLGYCYTPEKQRNTLIFSYVACEKKQEEEKRNAYMQKIELFDIPKEMKEASLSNIYKDDKARLPIVKYFKEFMSTYPNDTKGLYLTGSFGSGKTYLISALFNEMAKKGVRSALVYYPEFLRSLKSSFQSNYEEKFDYIRTIPLLLLDDIGAENCSNWSRDEVLGPLLQYRMENHLPTFFTSNLTLEELEAALAITNSAFDKVKARRIIERMKQLTITLSLVSKNRRD